MHLAIFAPIYQPAWLTYLLQAGTLMVSRVSTPTSTWTCLILLLSIHLAMNHAAVRAVSMHTLNRQRANLVISTMVAKKKVLKPVEVSARERIFEWDGALRWEGAQVIATARIGVSLSELVAHLGSSHSVTRAVGEASINLDRLVELYDKEDYIAWYNNSSRTALIVLKDGATPTSQLKAWAHVLMTAHNLALEDAISAASHDEAVLQQLKATLTNLSDDWDQRLTSLKAAGWDLGTASLETMSATRINLRGGR